MEPRTLQYMADASHGQRLSGAPQTLVRRVCTDSRQAQPEDLFLALRGDRFDGHAFIADAALKGVAAVLVERAALPSPVPRCGLIAVENTRSALGQIAGRYREDFSLPVVGVGGSNGKTTTKELLASVLRERFRTLASKASFNNDIGVPSTLLDLALEHEAAVLEFGTNHPGELAPLLRWARPGLGVLTSIGREHLEFFGNLEGVIREEGWLAELLPATGKLFLNGDTLGASEISRRSVAPVVRVGFGAINVWRPTRVQMDPSGISFDLQAPESAFCRQFHVSLLGRHQAVNACFAIAVGAELGLGPEEVQVGLRKCLPSKMRLEWSRVDQFQILDDSYNANADSMRAALETLRDFPCGGRRIAVLGDMAELGVHAAAAHAEIGEYAARTGVQHLLAVGKWAPVLARAAREHGLDAVEEFGDVEHATEALRQVVGPHDLVLLKASRATGLDRIRDLLRPTAARGPKNDWQQETNSPGTT